MSDDIKIGEKSEREYFNSVAKDYESKYGYFDEFTQYKIEKKVNRFIATIKKQLLNKKNFKILEIGCGTGTYTYKYSDKLHNAKILATDISEEMIKLSKQNCKSRENIFFKVCSAYSTGLKKSSVDVVCGFYILHHINLNKVKKELLRVLKPGGIAYFYEPNILNPIVYIIKSNKLIKKIIGDSPGEWAINPIKIKAQLKEFNIVELNTSEYVWPFQFIPFFLKLFLDKFTSFLFRNIPYLNLIGGSVEISLTKK